MPRPRDPQPPSSGAERRRPDKLRKQYENAEYPLVVLRFEDGHEIHVARGTGKSFDVWPGEMVRIVILWDPAAGDRELIGTRRGEEFDDARP